jgi:hypothetical protein
MKYSSENFLHISHNLLSEELPYRFLMSRHLLETSVKIYRSDSYVTADKCYTYNIAYFVSLFHTYISLMYQLVGKERH